MNGSSGSAQYWGTGTIDGAGTYDFKVWTADGALVGGDDTFRIQIRVEAGAVVFDNGNDRAIGGGQISIQVQKSG